MYTRTNEFDDWEISSYISIISSQLIYPFFLAVIIYHIHIWETKKKSLQFALKFSSSKDTIKIDILSSHVREKKN